MTDSSPPPAQPKKAEVELQLEAMPLQGGSAINHDAAVLKGNTAKVVSLKGGG